jgi:hypothetical protein
MDHDIPLARTLPQGGPSMRALPLLCLLVTLPTIAGALTGSLDQVVVGWWYQDDPQQVMQSTVPYTLEGPVGTEATTWSAIRGLFR